MNDDRLDPETVRREKELAASPLLMEMAKLPLRYAAAAVFGDLSGSSSEPIVRNGTASLVDFGNGPMAVTCSHVLDAYRQRVTEDPQTIFKIGDLQLDPLGAIIDESEEEELDLVTIDLREKKIDEIAGGGEIGSCFFRPLDWPPRNIAKGDSVLFGGFPERWRRQEPARVLQCASFSGRSLVTKVREKKDFVCQFERGYWVEPQWPYLRPFNIEEAKDLHDFGGLSGGPVFILRQGELYPEFVGIIYGFWSFDALCMRSVRFIGESGNISIR